MLAKLIDRLMPWRRQIDRASRVIAEQDRLISVLKQRACIVDLQASGREIVFTFMRDHNRVQLRMYNAASLNVAATRQELGLE